MRPEGTGGVIVAYSTTVREVIASGLFLFPGLEAALFSLTILEEKNMMFGTQKYKINLTRSAYNLLTERLTAVRLGEKALLRQP